jgi:hypothetical protein
VNYELAKRLRDASYPQHKSGCYINKQNILHQNPDALDPSVPTVKELQNALEELGTDPFVIKAIECILPPESSAASEILAEHWLKYYQRKHGNLPRALSNK